MGLIGIVVQIVQYLLIRNSSFLLRMKFLGAFNHLLSHLYFLTPAMTFAQFILSKADSKKTKNRGKLLYYFCRQVGSNVFHKRKEGLRTEFGSVNSCTVPKIKHLIFIWLNECFLKNHLRLWPAFLRQHFSHFFNPLSWFQTFFLNERHLKSILSYPGWPWAILSHLNITLHELKLHLIHLHAIHINVLQRKINHG